MIVIEKLISARTQHDSGKCHCTEIITDAMGVACRVGPWDHTRRVLLRISRDYYVVINRSLVGNVIKWEIIVVGIWRCRDKWTKTLKLRTVVINN